MKVWCGPCYQREESDRFVINQPVDEDGVLMYDEECDKNRYCIGIDGAQFMNPFQCDLCIFRTLFNRDPTQTVGDKENMIVIRRMNLDLIWSREPSTIKKNLSHLNQVISIAEASGMTPTLTCPGPFPFEDVYGWTIAFTMLVKSLQPGRHSRSYTQYATIRKLRSASSNLYHASHMGIGDVAVSSSSQVNHSIGSRAPTNSFWFSRWSLGCETRMGFILKQDKAISIRVMKALSTSFVDEIKSNAGSKDHRLLMGMGLAYSLIMFGGSLRGSEGLKCDYKTMMKYLHKGSTPNEIPHIVIPLRGRFKGEHGERCHLIPLSNVTHSNLRIRDSIIILKALREGCNIASPWTFVNPDGSKITFGQMNEIILDRLEFIKDSSDYYLPELSTCDVREEYSINRSFRRGSSTHAQNQQIPEPSINSQNRWRKTEQAKGKKQKFSMIENYGDIEQLIPALVIYSSML